MSASPQLINSVACANIKPAQVARQLIGTSFIHIFFFGHTIRGLGNLSASTDPQGVVSFIDFSPLKTTILFLADSPTVCQPRFQRIAAIT